jgi:hypothetical protein
VKTASSAIAIDWSVGSGLAGLVGVLVVGGGIAAGVLAARKHDRMFPKGFDRTGWEPEPGRAGRFATMWAWLAGGRGPS